MINRTIPLLALVLFLAFNTVEAGFIFEKDLRLGNSSQDVFQLQIFLNRFPDTKVSDFGPGAPGSETDYFGSKTLQSVIKFQEKYRNEILVPNGLLSATGFVGPSTRKKINEILSLGTSETTESVIDPVEAGETKQTAIFSLQPPKLFSVSKFQVAPGESLILSGTGFSIVANDIYLGSKKISSNLKSDNGTNLEVVIPNDFTEGGYNLWVSNALGDTKNQIQGDFVVVSKNPKPTSKISKIEPTEIHMDDIDSTAVIISGENFFSQNDIYSSLGNINNVRLENSSIKIFLSNLPEISKIKSIPSSVGKIKIPIYFFVKNESGITQTPALLYLNLN